jgi:polyhydroxyalkanoate synthase
MSFHLLEWVTPSRGDADGGLDEHADAIAECIGVITEGKPGKRPLLIGHSLGGTLAAIAAGGFGAFLNKYAPVRGGDVIILMQGK